MRFGPMRHEADFSWIVLPMYGGKVDVPEVACRQSIFLSHHGLDNSSDVPGENIPVDRKVRMKQPGQRNRRDSQNGGFTRSGGGSRIKKVHAEICARVDSGDDKVRPCLHYMAQTHANAVGG